MICPRRAGFPPRTRNETVSMSLISVTREDIPIGMPLPWPLYDQGGSVLLEQGAVVDSAERLNALMAAGPLRELSWSVPNGAAEPATDSAAAKPQLADAQESGFTFNDMRLRVGDRLQLQPPATVSQERYIVRLIGYLENASLLVTMPLENGLRVPLRENDKIVARVFTSQKAFGFTSTVERVCKIPYDYLHLSFPYAIQGSVVRKSPRVRTKIITSISCPEETDESKRQSGLIVNLSADGALVRARQPLTSKGEILRLAFRVNLHSVDAFLSVNAIVRSVFLDENGEGGGAPMHNHGLQFQELKPNDSVILQSMIYQQMIEQPQTLA
jgi:c-di-GMP-binding flagellar brake protein YcgR